MKASEKLRELMAETATIPVFMLQAKCYRSIAFAAIYRMEHFEKIKEAAK